MKKPITLLILLFTLCLGQMWGTTWTVAGNHEILNGSSDWAFDNSENDMINTGVDGWFGLLVTDKSLSAKTYYLKVGKDHGNSETYPASDYWLNISTAGTYNIIYSYHNATGNAVLAVPFKGWRVIGDAAVFGTSWGTTDTNNDMTKSGDWEYTLTKKNVHLAASTDYGFKVINDDDTYYTAESKVRVDAAGVYDVTITFNIVSKAISVSTTLKPSLVGEFNSWDVYANPFIDGKTSVELSSNTAFLVRYGGTDYKNNGTVSTSVCWTFFTDQGNCNLNVSEAGSGTYKFGWDHDTKQLTVIIPNDVSKSTLSKGKYIYFNDRHNSPGEVWKGDPWSDYSVRLALKDYATLDSVAKVDCNRSNVIEDSIFYFLISEIDDIGQVKIWRMNKEMSTFWDWSGEAKAIDRTSASQNCLSKKDDQLNHWRNWTPQWSTYCPIKKTCSISDNGTVTYGGNGTESTPFLVEKGTKVKVSATSTDYIEDANMTTKYNFYKDSQSQQNGEGTTYEFTASGTASTTHQINVNGYNYYNSTSSSNQFSTLLFYQTVTCYNVSYNANSASSGTVPAATTKYKQGDDISVLGNTGSLIREGYLFSGWNTKADGSGTHFDAGGTISGINKDTVLYADWKTMVKLYPTSGDFVDFPLTSLSDNTKALYIDKSKFADARPGNRIKIDGPDASVADNAKFFFGDYDVNHVPGSDFREVPTGSDVLPVYIYLTQEMIDYIKTHDLRIFGQNMTINRVELEVGRADEYNSQPQTVIWMGDYSANDLKTLNICIKGLNVTWSDYANLIIYHNAGHKNYNFNVRTSWEADGIITYLGDGYPHTVPENNYAIVPLTRAESAIEAAGGADRLLVQRDDQSGEKIPFTITSIVLEKSNAATGSSWSSATWSQGHAPTTDECAVITAPMTVDADHATAGRVVLNQSSSNTGKLTIQPNKGLDVRLTVKKTMDGSTLATTTPADLILESSSAGNASLIFENDENQATVLMYSKASIPNENTWNWQFMGIPFTSTNALYSYYNSYLYEWQSSGTWTEVANGGTMSPFTGYCITQTAATTYVMDGTLTPNNDVAISIPDGKEFVMANSWSAPILVSGFTNTTLPLTNQTIYLYNTGYNPEGGAAVTEGTESGTYVAIPIYAAPYTGNDLIAPMQGFYVDNTSGSAATITLKYNELVRPYVDRSIIAGPMHAPKKGVLENAQEDNRPVVLKLWANGALYSDRAVLLERSDFSTGFDNGWDGKKLSFGEVGPSVYVINTLGEPEAVSAIPDLEGTVVGFRAGTNNTCTMSFEYNGEDTFYLNDLQAQQSTQIASENSYTFTCTAGDNEARFVISATPISKTPTDVEPLTAHPSPLTVTKVLLNNHIYIIRDGRMFSMDGTLVK